MVKTRTKNINNSKNKSKESRRNARLSSEKESLGVSGLAGGNSPEGFPQLIRTDNEKIIEGSTNASIVIGKDRTSHMGSGYGGLGHTGASAIDIVVGRPGNSDEFVNPSFEKDAARIYISQKTDIDSNFGICEGDLGHSFERSAVAVKADAVRLVGREGIKIISGGDAENSREGEIQTFSGVEIIANNDDTDLQPIPKGDNLVYAIKELTALLNDLSGLLNAFATQQDAFNVATMTHFHLSPFYGIPTLPSETLVDQGLQTLQNHFQDVTVGLLNFTKNLALYQDTYTMPHGKMFINSRYNKVN